VTPSGAGFTGDSYAVSNCRFATEAYLGQSKVNVSKPWSKKTVFSGRNSILPGKAVLFRAIRLQI